MIPRGRRSDKKSETTDGEKRQLRVVCGSVKWVQRETRPHVSAMASLCMGSLIHSTVQDSCDENMAIERLKAEPFLGVKIPHIPIPPSALGYCSGHFWGERRRGSQVQLLQGLWNNLPSPFALLSHKSLCLKRKCSKYVSC